MAFTKVEIIGLVAIAIASITQITSVATVKWQIYETEDIHYKRYIDFGLFKICSGTRTAEICRPTSMDTEHKGSYDAVKATAVLSILSMLGLIGAIFLCKFVWNKSTLIPSIILGGLGVIFGLTTLIVYATSIKVTGSESSLYISFIGSCGAIGFYLIGISCYIFG